MVANVPAWLRTRKGTHDPFGTESGTGPSAEARRRTSRPREPGQSEGDITMLWTILVILVIIALAIFIIGALRGRGSRL